MPTPHAAPHLLRLAEVAQIFQVHNKTVYYWVRTGRLNALQTPGGLLRGRAEEVRRLADSVGFDVPSEFVNGDPHVVVLEADRHASRRFVRAARAARISCDVHDDPYATLIAVGRRSPRSVVLAGHPAGLDLARFVAAIRKHGSEIAGIAARGESLDELREAGISAGFELERIGALIATLATTPR